VIGPESEATNAVSYLFRIFVTLTLLLLGYECMVHALDLLNRPSDRAVYEGTAVLLLDIFFLPFALWRFWRRFL
jgi:hypothetical protein